MFKHVLRWSLAVIATVIVSVILVACTSYHGGYAREARAGAYGAPSAGPSSWSTEHPSTDAASSPSAAMDTGAPGYGTAHAAPDADASTRSRHGDAGLGEPRTASSVADRGLALESSPAAAPSTTAGADTEPPSTIDPTATGPATSIDHLTDAPPVRSVLLPQADASTDAFPAQAGAVAWEQQRTSQVVNYQYNQRQTGPGVLTAGSWNDWADPVAFDQMLNEVAYELPMSHGARAWFQHLTAPRSVIRVLDANGHGLGGVTVRIRRQGRSDLRLPTRQDGRVIIHHGLDHVPPESFVTVDFATQRSVSVGLPLLRPGEELIIPTLVQRDDQQAIDQHEPRARSLDLVLCLDTTGSMGDELRYLQTELDDIVRHIQAQHLDLEVRLGLITYRDHGDRYVVRTAGLTRYHHQVLNHLNHERAAGGGDEPEALDQAWAAAAQLDWSRPSPSSSRILIHVCDAPSHQHRIGATIQATMRLREQGVTIIPVLGSSGAQGGLAEVQLRTAALLTGGTYTWLTDDSGIGGAHAEPHIPYYQVEYLNTLLTRLIDSELRGYRVNPHPTTVLRASGQHPYVASNQWQGR